MRISRESQSQGLNLTDSRTSATRRFRCGEGTLVGSLRQSQDGSPGDRSVSGSGFWLQAAPVQCVRLWTLSGAEASTSSRPDRPGSI